MLKCRWWDEFKNNVNVKCHVGAKFLFNRLISPNSFLQSIRFETIFDQVQCDLSFV